MSATITTESLAVLTGITKRYPGVVALDGAELTIATGEVHGLLGENGAGKSTLIKILTGTERPQAGTVTFKGQPVTLTSPRQAQALGISVVHQERHLIPTFTVAENVLLDEILRNGRTVLDRKRIQERARPYLEMLGLDLDPARSVVGLSSAQAQLIEIGRALSRQSSLLILDEPTASIAVHEADALLQIIRDLRGSGVSVLYVSHKLEEVFAVCDRVTVLRDGRNAASAVPTTELALPDLVRLMVGREHVASEVPIRPTPTAGPVLEAIDVSGNGSEHQASFELRPGEILGWYGLVGAGRTELARVLIGSERMTSGTVRIDGKTASIRSVSRALDRYRIGYVSEDRQGEGLFLLHSIANNISSATWSKLRRRFGLFNPREEWRRALESRDQLSIKTPDVGQAVGTLSGGNKQKVSLAKWLVANPRVLIIDEPTVGIDIRTKYEIHDLIAGLADGGMGIILISSDLPEMVRLADRILVFRDGKIISKVENTKEYDVISEKVMASILAAEERQG